MAELKETVTITRPVDPRIADLVHFVRTLAGVDVGSLSDQELIIRAKEFWDVRHGED